MIPPVQDAALEEAILSTMMGTGEGDGANIQSLTPEDFTCPFRSRLYELLKEGRPYSDLETVMRMEGWQDGALVGITDLFLTPGIPRKELAASVAELKRLRLVRELCEEVDLWRVRAPHLSHQEALRTLKAGIRRSGTEASLRLLGGAAKPASRPSSST